MKSTVLVLFLMSISLFWHSWDKSLVSRNANGETKSKDGKPVVDVRNYGAIGDAQLATDCSIKSGEPVVSCASPHFASGDVGKSVAMWDAGPSVFKSPNSYVTTLSTTILSYQTPTQVTLAKKAESTASPSTHLVWGTNNYASLNVARETANALYPHGYVLFFPAGYYLTPVLDFPCGAIGTFGPDPVGGLKFICTSATRNVTIAGESATATTIENFKEDRGYVTGPSGECSDSFYTCALIRFGTHSAPNSSTDNDAHWVNGVTIHDLTLIDVKNGMGNYFNEPPAINLAATGNVEIYNVDIKESSYMCIFASGTGAPLQVHDNSLTHCGWGGPAYSATNAALNIFTPKSTVTRNRVYYSAQCFEGTAPFEEFSDNFCEGDDGKGNQPPASVSPILCLAANSVNPGFWNSIIKGNTCLNYQAGGGVLNGLGIMSNIVVEDNKFINTPGFALGDGVEANGGKWITGEMTSNIHGASIFRNNSFKFAPDFTIRSPTCVSLASAKEEWTIDGLAFQMPGPPLIGQSNCALGLNGSMPAWRPSTTYKMSTGNNAASVQPPMPNGFYYQAFGKGTGTSGITPPPWSTTEGATFADGTVIWKTFRKPVHRISNVSVSFPTSGGPNSIYAIINKGMLSTDVEFSNISSHGGSLGSGVGDGMYYQAPSQWLVAGFPQTFWSQSDDATPSTTIAIQIKNDFTYSSSYRSGMSNGVLPVGQYYRTGDVVNVFSQSNVSQQWICAASGWAAKRWAKSTVYPYNALVQSDPDNHHLFEVTDVSGCRSGSSEPTWQLGTGAIAEDTAAGGTCHWRESGPSAQFVLRPSK